MDFLSLQSDIILHLRGRRTQKELAQKLSFDTNKIYRLENEKGHLEWREFLDLCNASGLKPSTLLSQAFSYHDDPKNLALFLRLFMGRKKQEDFAKEIGVSRSVVSRWLTGKSSPNFVQMMSIMYNYSLDFFRFIELLTGSNPPASIKIALAVEEAHIRLYSLFPWLSILLSALDLPTYQESPSINFLVNKTKLTEGQINEALKALQEQDLLIWTGNFWKTKIRRLRIRGTPDSRRNSFRFAFRRALDNIDTNLGKPGMRYSWKAFSINRQQAEKIQKKYSEFFNEIGQLIDEGQENAENIYLLTMSLLDVEQMSTDDDEKK